MSAAQSGSRPLAKVLFCCLSLHSAAGGIQRFNARVLDGLVRRAAGGEVAVRVLADTGREPGADNRGFSLRGFAGRRLRFLTATLASALRAELVLLDHMRLLPLAVLIRIARPRVPIVLFAHGIEVWGEIGSRRRRRLERAMLRFAIRRIACVSRYTTARMMAAYGLPAQRFRLLPNAVTVGGEPAPVRNGDDGGLVTVLTVTRLDNRERYKNVDTVVKAVAALRTESPRLRLEIVGDGTLRPELEALARSEGLDGAVVFRGRVSDEELAAAYGRASLFALPSTMEGFGIAYLEAWLWGLPVIGSDEGAAPEVIQDGIDGLLVPGRDVAALSAAIRGLAADPELRRRLGKAGRAKVESLYGEDSFDRNLDAILDELAAR
ncbi:MAG: glycosyl transferase group 1 [Enterovirga sp.]|nr:glycosyl transferase group 1 [Enterovirga sp.]